MSSVSWSLQRDILWVETWLPAKGSTSGERVHVEALIRDGSLTTSTNRPDADTSIHFTPSRICHPFSHLFPMRSCHSDEWWKHRAIPDGQKQFA
jgi:hypothetical protein